MRTLQQKPFNLVTFLAYLILAIITIACIASLVSCSPQKQIDKAYQKVLADSAAMEKMRAVVERIWPCVPAIGKPGKTTTITNTVVDTAQVKALQHIVDSILAKQVITPATNIDSLKRAISVEILKTVKPVIIHDISLRVDTLPDTRAIELMQQRLDAALQEKNNLQGQIIAKDKQYEQLEKTANTRLYILIGLGVIAATFLGVGTYLKYFTPASGAKNLFKGI